MADEGVQSGQPAPEEPARPSGIAPASAPGTAAMAAPPDGYVSVPVRLLIYLIVTAVMTGIWVFVLRTLGYSGTNPTLVSVVLGIITFASCRSFVVDRFIKLPHAAEITPQPIDNVREIIETVVFVVVLVLLLKSFVAEAFQIPTGSMAETLYGYQKIVKCPVCGYRFPVNSSDEMERPGSSPLGACVCENCEKLIQLPFKEVPGQTPEPVLPNFAMATDVSDGNGDRVLVAKFLYDLLSRDPDRLDVVVFKFPGESSDATRGDRPFFPGSGPYKGGTQMNYIKRLVGLPGEAIAIHRGKLYVLPRGHGLPFEDADKDIPQRKLWMHEFMHQATSNPDIGSRSDLRAYETLWNNPNHPFQIVRKSPANIVAMKRIVYDNDFIPTDGIPTRWNGWTAAGNGFTSPTPASQPVWLRYSHILRSEDGSKAERELITDFMGYNNGVSRENLRIRVPYPRGNNWVSDLVLETEVEIAKAEGELILELSKGIDRYQARFDLSSGSCKLVRLRSVKNAVETTDMGSPVVTALKKPGTYRLRFSDVDQRLTVWIDKELPFGEGVSDNDPPPLHQSGPLPKNDLEPASIGVVNAQATARSIKLYRDTYYTALSREPADVVIPHWTESVAETWTSKLNGPMPVLFQFVQPEHFLCLGDNSPHSSDGRSWGTVPRRLLLGRALLIYWPCYPVNRIGRID